MKSGGCLGQAGFDITVCSCTNGRARGGGAVAAGFGGWGLLSRQREQHLPREA